ncbi:MAG: GNAT family N-acetyltransferase [Actinomycetota bacterium]|nr:GNAT family N-acetyltransferase [Actinomycetota bacterium]
MIEVRAAAGPPEVWAALDLRREVFVDEQGVALQEDRDGRDHAALHLVAVDGGELVGTCRLLGDGDRMKLGRMVVRASARGRGVARLLLAEADARARDLGATTIVLGAQLTATGVYERAGYERYGDVFDDAGIDHVMMRKDL